jgi:DNA invertase Pin-like site-specific DNA recombinase
MQLDELRRTAEQRGWVVTGEYVDHGVSGSKDRRPELDRMMADVRKGGANAPGIVACWRFDRFARSVRHLVMALDEFSARGVEFVSLQDGIDTSTSIGRFTFHIVAAVAQLERDLIRGRVQAGVDAARRRGARLGRPRVRIDLERARTLLAEPGASVRKVSKLLGCGASTLAKALMEAPSELHPGAQKSPEADASGAPFFPEAA